jgi:uncharacterized protein DUF1707/cell wall-active antibiotic response 4TMS protein YvqF
VTEPHLPAQRASDDDRDRVVDLLRTASIDGRLDLEELAERTERAQLARTRGELAELTADIAAAPARPPAVEPQRHRVWFSGHKRRGRWRPAATSRYLSVCATIHLDLRQAVLPGPEIELEIRSWFGTTTVLVPEGVEVELTGGGFGATRNVEVEGEPGPDAPLVRIRTRGPFGTLNVRSRPRLRDTMRENAEALAQRISEEHLRRRDP